MLSWCASASAQRLGLWMLLGTWLLSACNEGSLLLNPQGEDPATVDGSNTFGSDDGSSIVDDVVPGANTAEQPPEDYPPGNPGDFDPGADEPVSAADTDSDFGDDSSEFDDDTMGEAPPPMTEPAQLPQEPSTPREPEPEPAEQGAAMDPNMEPATIPDMNNGEAAPFLDAGVTLPGDGGTADASVPEESTGDGGSGGMGAQGNAGSGAGGSAGATAGAGGSAAGAGGSGNTAGTSGGGAGGTTAAAGGTAGAGAAAAAGATHADAGTPDAGAP
jgi:hypothetical protein